MPRLKAAKLFVSFFVVIATAVFAFGGLPSASEFTSRDGSFSLDAKHPKGTPAQIRMTVLYPSNGILSPGQSQIVQIGNTVQPSPGTLLNEYLLVLKLKQNGRKVLLDSFHPTQTSSVTALSLEAVAPGKYDLTAELERSGTTVFAPQQIRIRKQKHPGATTTPTVTATQTPTLTPAATPSTDPSSTSTPTPTATVTQTATQTATMTATATRSSTATATATVTGTGTATRTATKTATSTPTSTPSTDPSSTSTATATLTVTASATTTPTATSTVTQTATGTATATPTPWQCLYAGRRRNLCEWCGRWIQCECYRGCVGWYGRLAV